HRIEMRVQPRHQPLAESLDDPRGLYAGFVILKPPGGRQSGHADVVRGLAIAFRISQVDDVHAVMVAGARGRDIRLQSDPHAMRESEFTPCGSFASRCTGRTRSWCWRSSSSGSAL